MIETFTSINNLNSPQHGQENAEEADGLDLVFYESIKSQLNRIKRDPSEESISRILAYSKKK